MELIKHYAGTGIPELTKTGIWANKEICVADTEIGYVYGSNGKRATPPSEVRGQALGATETEKVKCAKKNEHFCRF